ncbi:MAG TPA: bifunctional precorrin-2 dehydrogenase/sirohydrochlorin ferrochelatase [Clostridia bacterium]|nr:bifunctional precorrin-2 dehydrogenase/sirohydrochlorin ferrochelatase [Clostridia bacterium]
MNYYPVLLDLNSRACLVVGGGSVAERKIKSLLSCGARVRVVSPDLTLDLKEMVSKGKLEYLERGFQKGDTKGFFIVICATDKEEVNRQVAEECRESDKPVNVVDDPPKCSFILPAIVRRGALTVSVSTAGKSPLLAAKIRRSLEGKFSPEYGEILDLLGNLRKEIIGDVKDPKQRLKMFEKMLDDQAFALLEQGKYDDVRERVLSAYRSFGNKPQDSSG